MLYITLFSMLFVALLLFASLLLRIAGFLRLTIPLIYFFLIATVLNGWASAHEKLALTILFILIGFSILGWVLAFARQIRNNRYQKFFVEDIKWQIDHAREQGLSLEDIYFDSHGTMRYSDTNKPVI